MAITTNLLKCVKIQ